MTEARLALSPEPEEGAPPGAATLRAEAGVVAPFARSLDPPAIPEEVPTPGLPRWALWDRRLDRLHRRVVQGERLCAVRTVDPKEDLCFQ